MSKVLLVWNDGRKTIVDVEISSPDATLMITGSDGKVYGFEATHKIEDGLDVYEEEKR